MRQKMVSMGVVCFWSTLAACAGEPGTTARSAELVIKNANAITMNGEGVSRNTSVIVSNGKIKALGQVDDLRYSDDAVVVDAGGKYLTPGFADMHVHVINEKDMSLYLANGVTSIRVMWGSPRLLELRRSIKQRDLLGPEMFSTGPLIDGPSPKWPGSFVLDKVDDVSAAIRQMKDDGYEFIKIYDRLSLPVFDKILAVAGEIGIPVVGHVPANVAMDHALQSGLYSVEHFTHYRAWPGAELDREVSLTFEHGVWNCPTLVVLKSLGDLEAARRRVEPLLKYVRPEELAWWSERGSFGFGIENWMRLTARLVQENGNVVVGTDVGNPYVIAGFSLHEEFELMAESGLSPYQVLFRATVAPARMLGVEARAGTIEVGKDADLVLLDENPLDDIRNTRSIRAVVSKGTWIPKENLQAMLDEVEASNRPK